MGNIIPRRAGMSSFCFSDVNAHILIEEYFQPFSSKESKYIHNKDNLDKQVLMVLSTKIQEQLKIYVTNLLKFICISDKIKIVYLKQFSVNIYILQYLIFYILVLKISIYMYLGKNMVLIQYIVLNYSQ